MKVGPLQVVFHRTVRVADGRSPANLPPSLGKAKVTAVSQFREQCPESWEDSGVFIPLHDTEALWIAFHPDHPVAVMVGAGGINALTGEKLGITLAAGNYMVCPPQPWLDGWKSDDGSVYQFVATPFKGGDGLSVGEQILGAESVSGGIGIAVFDSKEPLAPHAYAATGSGFGPYDEIGFASKGGMQVNSEPVMRGGGARGMTLGEMGVGKGGKITQKIHADPHGIEVWKPNPTATMAVYLVDAKTYEEIVGETVPLPIGQDEYKGKWFAQDDVSAADVPGTSAFTGLASVFPAAKDGGANSPEPEAAPEAE